MLGVQSFGPLLRTAIALSSMALLSFPAAYAAGTRSSIIIKAPDLTAYDCSALSAGFSTQTLRVGQVISGRYYEWNEIYRIDGGSKKLACIGLTVPTLQQLDVAHAQAFISHSTAIGAPTAAAPINPDSGANAASIEPPDVKPEPAKRVLPGPKSTGSSKPTPPLPATKTNVSALNDAHVDGTAPVAVAPQNTNSLSALVPDAAAPIGPTQVNSTTSTSYPWNTVGYLSVTYPDGESFRCSGTLVSAYVVLTAGHCIHNNTRGGYVKQVRFYPGQNTDSNGNVVTPYGVKTNWSNLQVTQTWSQISGPDSFDVIDYASDFAAIQFATPFTYTSTFMPIIYESVESGVTNAGYPATVANQSATAYGLYFMEGDEDSDSQNGLEFYNVREFSVGAAGGNSGGPFWFTDNLGRSSLVGSLSYGSTSPNSAGGPWYNYWNYQLLSNWVAWTPGAASLASLPTDGTHVGSVFSSAQSTTQSLLRFYNTGGVSGTVSLTLEDYVTGASLATWTSAAIPSNGELQFAISTIESQASASFTKPLYYSLSIRPGITGYFQHVALDLTTGTLTNLSTCDSGTINNPGVLVGVHSSLLDNGYPSTVVVYNTGTAATKVQLGIYDARNGNQIGTYVTPSVPGSGQIRIASSTIESAIGQSPATGEFHYLVEAENYFTGYIQNLVTNQKAGVITDMSEMCILAPA